MDWVEIGKFVITLFSGGALLKAAQLLVAFLKQKTEADTAKALANKANAEADKVRAETQVVVLETWRTTLSTAQTQADTARAQEEATSKRARELEARLADAEVRLKQHHATLGQAVEVAGEAIAAAKEAMRSAVEMGERLKRASVEQLYLGRVDMLGSLFAIGLLEVTARELTTRPAPQATLEVGSVGFQKLFPVVQSRDAVRKVVESLDDSNATLGAVFGAAARTLSTPQDIRGSTVLAAIADVTVSEALADGGIRKVFVRTEEAIGALA